MRERMVIRLPEAIPVCFYTAMLIFLLIVSDFICKKVRRFFRKRGGKAGGDDGTVAIILHFVRTV